MGNNIINVITLQYVMGSDIKRIQVKLESLNNFAYKADEGTSIGIIHQHGTSGKWNNLYLEKMVKPYFLPFQRPPRPRSASPRGCRRVDYFAVRATPIRI